MSQENEPTDNSASKSKNRLWLALDAGLILVLVVGFVVYQLWPTLRSADEEAIAAIMPNETAVFLELNILNLQNEATRNLAAEWAATLPETDDQLNAADPSTLFNLLDDSLREVSGLTVSEDIRPWIGLKAGLGLLPFTAEETPRWLIAATVRDEAAAAAFVQTLNNTIQTNPSPTLSQLASDPVAAIERGVVLIASDPEALTQAQATAEGLALVDSIRFQSTLEQLPGDQTLTLFAVGDHVVEYINSATSEADADLVETALTLLPTYDTLGLAASAAEGGVSLAYVGHHGGLTPAQTAWQEAQKAPEKSDAWLPGETAVYYNGQRLDALWPLVKVSLAVCCASFEREVMVVSIYASTVMTGGIAQHTMTTCVLSHQAIAER